MSFKKVDWKRLTNLSAKMSILSLKFTGNYYAWMINELKIRVVVFPGARPFAWPPTLAPNLYLPSLAPICIYQSCPQFVFVGPCP